MADTLFPTTVIGSLPRPQWVREIILDRKDGNLSEEQAERLLDPAVETALSLQERAGVEEITDGEWRRESYVKVFAERVRGFKPDLIDIQSVKYPAVVEPVEYFRPLVLDEINFARPRTQRRLKATLPAPYIIARVEEAMQYVDKERITLHPDCGFSPSMQNPMDLDEAYLKLKSMCQAAHLLRDKYS
tara:strand:- start:195 stop:758 length:564 start_codon:yes stop_codon:yes gene_type:complete